MLPSAKLAMVSWSRFRSTKDQPSPHPPCPRSLFCPLTICLTRTSSQKPGDELLANFRQQFPEAAVGASGAQQQPGQPAPVDNHGVGAPPLDGYVHALLLAW